MAVGQIVDGVMFDWWKRRRHAPILANIGRLALSILLGIILFSAFSSDPVYPIPAENELSHLNGELVDFSYSTKRSDIIKIRLTSPANDTIVLKTGRQRLIKGQVSARSNLIGRQARVAYDPTRKWVYSLEVGQMTIIDYYTARAEFESRGQIRAIMFWGYVVFFALLIIGFAVKHWRDRHPRTASAQPRIPHARPRQGRIVAR